MVRLLILPLLLLATVTACEKSDTSTCEADGASCVRIRNEAGLALENVRLRLVSGEAAVSVGDVPAGGTNEYVAFAGADWCNFMLEATDENGSAFKSGDWIHSNAAPLGDGQFTILLTLSPQLPPDVTILDAELMED